MTLISSISGIRGTIGGNVSEALTPIDIVKYVAAYATMVINKFGTERPLKVVVGRDARVSGQMVDSIVCGTLSACGINVVNCSLASTPTVEMAVVFESADGGIIITASHNPREWNALKLLNENGEFLDSLEGTELLEIVRDGRFPFCGVEKLGKITYKDFTAKHIEAVYRYPLVDTAAIRAARFRVVVDGVNSVGGIIIPALLQTLGVECIKVNCDPTGEFAHNPEPLPQHLKELSERVMKEGAHLGISVDPDVDRLALVCEDGSFFGEEYTLVSVADYILSQRPGPTVSNLSSSRALRDVTEKYGCSYSASAVGEVNVTTEMKRVGAVIGGEGNGGVIVPDLHYGRDALIGVALFLSLMAQRGQKPSQIRDSLPKYVISKNKIELSDTRLIAQVLDGVRSFFASEKVSTIDGVKIDFEHDKRWVHLRRSNTEPIIRIYSEASDKEKADELASKVIDIVKEIIR